jgi:hypothetical protein
MLFSPHPVNRNGDFPRTKTFSHQFAGNSHATNVLINKFRDTFVENFIDG